MKPLGNRILIEPIEAPSKTDGGLYIPEMAREQSQIATVIELGTGELNEKGERVPFEFKAGQRVLVDKYGGAVVEVQAKRCKIVEASSVLAVL